MKGIYALLLVGLFCFAAVDAHAAEFNSVAVAGGIAIPEGSDATFYLHASLRWLLNDNWALEPEFGFLDQDEAEEECLARGCIVFGLRDISLGSNILYTGAIGRVQMFFGGGAAAHFRERQVTKDVEPPENPADLSETRLGLHVIYGADFPVNNSFDITTSAREDFIFRDEEDGGTQGVFKLYAGLRFYFD